jgi:hypothetical protein
MGSDGPGTLTIDGRTFRGTAQLEQKQLLFRGDIRLIIPLDGIDEARAQDGRLIVRFGGRLATLEIGASAARWAARITNPPTRLAKLGVKPGMRLALIDLEDDTFPREIASGGAVVENGPRTGDLDQIFLGVRTVKDLSRLGTLSKRLKPSGAIWVTRAKGAAATVSESESMAAGKRAGLVDVKVVSFSDTHTAEKYVIPVAKRAQSGRSASPSARTRGSAPSRGRS